MARRRTEKKAQRKSPLNLAIGGLLKRLRELKGWKPEQAAPVLGIAPTYLGAIETGTRALPPQCAVGLTALGADFLMGSALLTLAGHLDCRDKHNPTIYDFDEVQRRAELIKGSGTAPFFDELLEIIVIAIRKLKADEFASIEDSINDALSLLLTLVRESLVPSKVAQSSVRSFQPLGSYKLSPVFEDIIDSLAGQLALLPPHINFSNFKTWEEKIAPRVKEVRAYVDSAERFLKDAENFDWTLILYNLYRPPLRIFIGFDDPMQESVAENQFRNRSNLSGRSAAKAALERENIAFVRIRKKLQPRIENALVYDYADGRIVSKELWEQSGNRLVEEKRFQQFNNAWIYDAVSESTNKSGGGRLIGVLGAYNDNDPSAFGIMMDSQSVEDWWKITEEALQ